MTSRRRRGQDPKDEEQDSAPAPRVRNRRLTPRPGLKHANQVDAESGEHSLAEEVEPYAATPLASVPPGPKEPSALARKLQGVRRVLWTITRLALVAMGVVGAIALGRLIRDFALTAEAFAIDTITLDGNERIEDDDILSRTGITLGTNVFERSALEIERDLVNHPWIASATVRRQLPAQFSIEVTEHQPVAIVALRDSLYLIGEDASVFKQVEPGDPVDFPILSGADADRFTRDRAYRTGLLTDFVGLLHDLRAAGLWRREPLQQLTVDSSERFTAYLGEDGLEVSLGRGPFLAKLQRLRRVLSRLGDERPLYVRLDNDRRPGRVIVRLPDLIEPVVEEPAPSESVQANAQASDTSGQNAGANAATPG